MKLMTELLGLEEAKKPKCTCEADEATCEVHVKKLDESTEEYEDSAEFTGDWTDASAQLTQFKKIVSAPKFRAWLKVTDSNYSVRAENVLGQILSALDALDNSWEDLETEIDKADNS